ncbi:MAG: ATP-binding cassette domain-containing protein [Nitriliruptorales bacterium]|nr:ATP-binding cassette domain-containing protein [Nitriliruptorales bacterium]
MPTSSPHPKIQADGVNVAFPVAGGTTFQAIEDLTASVESGEFVCLLGPSGCGKSTFLNLVAGYQTPTWGTLTMDGEPIKGPGRDRVMVFQDYSLFEWRTVLHNVTFGLEMAGIPRRERVETAREYLRLVGLASSEDKYPHALSGGMKQRVGIARALAIQPEVLLMDEPFGALDAQTRLVMQDEMLRIWEETRTTVLFVTHAVDEAIFLADRIFVLTASPGRLKAIVPVEMPRPRTRTSRDFVALYEHLEDLLRDEVMTAVRREAGEGADGGDAAAGDGVQPGPGSRRRRPVEEGAA